MQSDIQLPGGCKLLQNRLHIVSPSALDNVLIIIGSPRPAVFAFGGEVVMWEGCARQQQ